jgi:hypothetical protein
MVDKCALETPTSTGEAVWETAVRFCEFAPKRAMTEVDAVSRDWKAVWPPAQSHNATCLLESTRTTADQLVETMKGWLWWRLGRLWRLGRSGLGLVSGATRKVREDKACRSIFKRKFWSWYLAQVGRENRTHLSLSTLLCKHH